MKILLLGATGLVGGQVLALALADARVASVIAPTRRALPPHPKLTAPLVDFARPDPAAHWWQVDAVVCALGTTMRAAGSQAAFRQVDHDYPLAFARLARAHGAATCVLNSAAGADAKARFFYHRVKGELERDLLQLGYASLTFVRPGLIGGKRNEWRLAEGLAVAAVTLASPLLPRRWRVNPAATIARALLAAVLDPQPGQHVVPAEQLTSS